IANDDRSRMPGVHILQDPRRGFVFRVEERSEKVRRGRIVDQSIYFSDQSGGVRVMMKCLSAKSRVKASHDQRRWDSFSRYVSDGDPPASTLQLKNVVIIASQAEGRLVKSLGPDTGDGNVAGREERLLNVLGAFDVSANCPVFAGIHGGF